MSRTYKDKPYKYKYPEDYDYTYGTEMVPYEYTYISPYNNTEVTTVRYWHKQVPGAKTKKKKEIDTNWHWMQSTPSWWTRMTMNRPQRRAAHLWEREATMTPIEELEELDTPNTSHKPHIYYW